MRCSNDGAAVPDAVLLLLPSAAAVGAAGGDDGAAGPGAPAGGVSTLKPALSLLGGVVGGEPCVTNTRENT